MNKMVRPKTIEKYKKINNMLQAGSTIRHIKATLNCSDDTINKAKAYVPKKIRTPNPIPIKPKSAWDKAWEEMDGYVPQNKRTNRDKKGTFDLNIIVLLKEIFRSYGKQYWKKSPERIVDLQKVEAYLFKREGINFSFVLTRKMEEALEETNKEIMEANGGY